MSTKLDYFILQAARDLVHGFSAVPQSLVASWLHDHVLAMPAHDYLFLVNESVDQARIKRLFVDEKLEPDEISDRAQLVRSGWKLVGKTGLWAFDFEEFLALGVNGGGYNFYEAHWVPLYEALGYEWHIHKFRHQLLLDDVEHLAKEMNEGVKREGVKDEHLRWFVKRVCRRLESLRGGYRLSKAEKREGVKPA